MMAPSEFGKTHPHLRVLIEVWILFVGVWGLVADYGWWYNVLAIFCVWLCGYIAGLYTEERTP